MKAKITFEIKIGDFLADYNYTIPQAEIEIEELITDAVAEVLDYPDRIKIEITNE